MSAYYNEYERVGIAYVITCEKNSKVYVGITVRGLRRRWTDHLRAARTGVYTALYCAIRKYGAENFNIRQVASSKSKEDLKLLERCLIEQYESFAPSGYNLTFGGDGVDGLPSYIVMRTAEKNRGRKQSEEAKRRIGAASKWHVVTDEVREKIRAKHLGKTLTEEHRAKLSAAKIGKKLPTRSAEHSARISRGLTRAHARKRGYE